MLGAQLDESRPGRRGERRVRRRAPVDEDWDEAVCGRGGGGRVAPSERDAVGTLATAGLDLAERDVVQFRARADGIEIAGLRGPPNERWLRYFIEPEQAVRRWFLLRIRRDDLEID